MDNIHYLTLAAVRAADPEAFDATFKQALAEAAAQVGNKVVFDAFCGPDQKALAQAA
jgi:hypothetical protein